MTTEQSISGCKKGDRKSQSVLFKLYADKLFAVGLRYTRDENEAQDILHEAFMKIFKSIVNFSGNDKNIEYWMKRIVINEALQLKRKQNKIVLNNYMDHQSAIIQVQPDILSSISVDEIKALILELPEDLKSVFNLYVVDQMSHKEICTYLDISESLSKTRLHRARTLIKNKIIQQNIVSNVG